MSIDGVLNVNKPEGKTSFGVVAWLKRLTGENHVGHAGTLDPLATGVLPICFGQGTRIVQFLANSSKSYRAEIELGTSTDTFDKEGKVTQQRDPGDITVSQIEEALVPFRGIITQVPPVYSALKHQGRRYYELARAGVPVEVPPRQVEIIRLELVDWLPPIIKVEVDCGKGTYIRSLANDLGQLLGCGACLKSLVRLKYGPFHIENALTTSQIEDAFRQGTWEHFICATDTVLLNWGTVIVAKGNESAIRNGRSLSLGDKQPPSEEYCRAYSLDGRFIAVLRFVPGKKLWHPKKVFSL